MTISQPLESILIGVGDNYIVVDDIDSYIDVVFTIRGSQTEVFNHRYTANEGRVNLNLREITRLVYDNLSNYEDPFDYTTDVLYSETQDYHFIKMDIDITDANVDNIQVNDIKVINAALDVGECLILTSLLDEVLNDDTGKTVQVLLDSLNYDLNFTLH